MPRGHFWMSCMVADTVSGGRGLAGSSPSTFHAPSTRPELSHRRTSPFSIEPLPDPWGWTAACDAIPYFLVCGASRFDV